MMPSSVRSSRLLPDSLLWFAISSAMNMSNSLISVRSCNDTASVTVEDVTALEGGGLEPEERFRDQGRGLKGVARPLPLEVLARDAPELVAAARAGLFVFGAGPDAAPGVVAPMALAPKEELPN